MESLSDIVNWILAALAAVVFFNYKAASAKNTDSFKALFKSQREHGERLVQAETMLLSMNENLSRNLDDIKIQGAKTAEDVNSIKVALASIPRSPRRRDQ